MEEITKHSDIIFIKRDKQLTLIHAGNMAKIMLTEDETDKLINIALDICKGKLQDNIDFQQDYKLYIKKDSFEREELYDEKIEDIKKLINTYTTSLQNIDKLKEIKSILLSI